MPHYYARIIKVHFLVSAPDYHGELSAPDIIGVVRALHTMNCRDPRPTAYARAKLGGLRKCVQALHD